MATSKSGTAWIVITASGRDRRGDRKADGRGAGDERRQPEPEPQSDDEVGGGNGDGKERDRIRACEQPRFGERHEQGEETKREDAEAVADVEAEPGPPHRGSSGVPAGSQTPELDASGFQPGPQRCLLRSEVGGAESVE